MRRFPVDSVLLEGRVLINRILRDLSLLVNQSAGGSFIMSGRGSSNNSWRLGWHDGFFVLAIRGEVIEN